MKNRDEIKDMLMQFEKGIRIGLEITKQSHNDISPFKANLKEFLKIMRGIQIYLEWVVDIESKERQQIEQRIDEEIIEKF